jgi:hypothetical protein
MMRMRGDLACFHEPYGEAWYQGDDARAPRLAADSLRKPGLSFASVLERLQDLYQDFLPHYQHLHAHRLRP